MAQADSRVPTMPSSNTLTLTAIPLDRQSDASLVAAARRTGTGASDAFGELVHRYQRMVYALALSLVRDADADDVAQEAFLAAFRNLDLLADPAKFGVWLRRITFGVAIDHVRADRSRGARVIESPDQGDDDATTAGSDFADPGPSPLQRLERSEVADRVMAALDRMPARYRVPLALYHIDGLTHSKVARTLGVPEATVRSLVSRARRKLARLLANAPEARDMTDETISNATGSTARLRSSSDVLDDSATTPRFLHVLNGDAVRVTLERSEVPGTFAVYADVLHEGPIPRLSGTASSRETRARYVAARGYLPYPDAVRFGEEWDARLEAFASYDEVVLWFEHDLFDQLLLVRHLDWFGRRNPGRTNLSLICIGEFPGFEPFHGLGQLDADQLTSLLGTRQPVSAAQMSLGRQAWEAFTAGDPTALDRLARDAGDDTLPFLPGALGRLIEEYPATGTGLPRTEREILELLAERSMTPVELFVAEQAREERVFMGDTTFWKRVETLASGGTPLVALDVEPMDEQVIPDGLVRITDAGHEVIAGRADWIRLTGFDKWIGGVHLTAPPGGDVTWRYDPCARRLVHA